MTEIFLGGESVHPFSISQDAALKIYLYDDDGVEDQSKRSVTVTVYNVRRPSWLVMQEEALSFNIDVGIIVCSSIVCTEYLIGVWDDSNI